MKIKFTVNSAILALTAVCVVASVGMAFKYYSKSDMKNNADYQKQYFIIIIEKE